MSKEKGNKDAERILLATLASEPTKMFDVHGVWIDEKDFGCEEYRCIYSALLVLAKECDSVDAILVEEKVASIFPQIYAKKDKVIGVAVADIFNTDAASDLESYVEVVVSHAVRRRAKSHIRKLEKTVVECRDYRSLLSAIEGDTVDFCKKQLRSADVIQFRDSLNNFIRSRINIVKRGDTELGIKSGFEFYDDAIGGGHRRGAIDLVVARPKVGKSFHAMNKTFNVASEGIPVLYMDTELNEEIFLARMLSIGCDIPIFYSETGRFLKKEKYRDRVKANKKSMGKLPIDYVEIGGWDLQKQISLIRSWVGKRVGKDEEGRTAKCLVVLDYLKLMGQSDKGFNEKEYEAVGYRMSALHDLVRELDVPMFTMAQVNRVGEVSMSDRLNWFADSVTFFMKRPMDDIVADYESPDKEEDEEPANMMMKVDMSRYGAGGSDDEYIMMYADINNPHLNSKRKSGKMTEMSVTRYVPPSRRKKRGEED